MHKNLTNHILKSKWQVGPYERVNGPHFVGKLDIFWSCVIQYKTMDIEEVSQNKRPWFSDTCTPELPQPLVVLEVWYASDLPLFFFFVNAKPIADLNFIRKTIMRGIDLPAAVLRWDEIMTHEHLVIVLFCIN